MKTFIAIISAIVILVLYGFMQDSNVKDLLEKPETRQEVINTILNNHEYMTEFIQAMHGNRHAMMMMNGNGQMSGNNMMSGSNMMGNNGSQAGMMGNSQYPMMNQSQMMNMMHQNPAMMQMMMGNMMNAVSTDSTMSHNMVGMMYRNPQMMQMMMQMMHNSNMWNSGASTGNTSSVPAPKK
jgi:hypothetical protein